MTDERSINNDEQLTTSPVDSSTDASIQSQPAAPATQSQRWLKYGLSLAILLTALIALTVFLNLIAHRMVKRHPILRTDLSSTRQYSLSTQTKKILSRLDQPINITTFYVKSKDLTRSERRQIERVEELLAEYNRQSDLINVQQIDPSTDSKKLSEFHNKLKTRFTETLAAYREKFTGAEKVLNAYSKFSVDISNTQILQKTIQTINANSTSLIGDRSLASAVVFLTRFTADLLNTTTYNDQLITKFSQALNEPLPNLGNARLAIHQALEKHSRNAGQAEFQPLANDVAELSAVTQALSTISKSLSQSAEHLSRQPNLTLAQTRAIQQFRDVESKLAPVILEFQRMRERISNASFAIASLLYPIDYEQVRHQISQTNAIVAMTSTSSPLQSPASSSMRVKTLRDVFPVRAAKEDNNSTQTLQQVFKGEEVITGILMQLTYKHNSKVVFVNPMRFPMLTSRKNGFGLSHIADRLRAMNFKVEEWFVDPIPQKDNKGQTKPTYMPYPKADPGQRMIIVMLPNLVRQQSQNLREYHTRIATVMARQLLTGQPVIISPYLQFKTRPVHDATLKFPERFSINILADQLILTQRAVKDDQLIADLEGRIRSWNDSHPISKLLRGLNGRHRSAMPIQISEKKPGATNIHILAYSGQDTWASKKATASFLKPHELKLLKPEKGEQKSNIPFAALAEQPGTSLKASITGFVKKIEPQSDALGIQGQQLYIGETRHFIPRWKNPTVKVGDQVKKGDPISTPGTDRLVVIADPFFLLDGTIMNARESVTATDNQGKRSAFIANPGNSELFINAVYHLADLGELIAASPSTQQTNRIAFITPTARTAVWWIIVGLMPAMFLVIGSIVYFVRRK